MKKVFLFAALIIFVGSVFAGMFLESYIRDIFPAFSGIKLISIVLLVLGIAFAIAERNLMIGILTIIVILMIPWVHDWLRDYWPYIAQIYRDGG